MKTPELKRYKELDLVYNNKFRIYKYHDMNKFKRNSIESKNNDLDNFHRHLDKFNILEPRKECTKEQKNKIKVSFEELHKELLENSFNQYINLSFSKIRKLRPD